MLGADVVANYHREEAAKVIEPIQTFLGHHTIALRCRWVAGSPCDEILEAANAEKVHLIVPVLLVK